MTQFHLLDSNSSKLDFDSLARSNSTIVQSVVTISGQFSVVHRPPRGWYVQHKEKGVYTVVHNLEKLDYGVSVSKITDENLSLETSNLTKVSFTVTVKQNGELVDKPFAFALNVRNNG